MSDLIDLDYARQNIPTSQDSDEPAISTLITAASRAIIKYCRRDFNQTAYDELYNGTGDRRLLLRQCPLLSIQSVRYRPVTVLKIQNNLANTPIAGHGRHHWPNAFLANLRGCNHQHNYNLGKQCIRHSGSKRRQRAGQRMERSRHWLRPMAVRRHLLSQLDLFRDRRSLSRFAGRSHRRRAVCGIEAAHLRAGRLPDRPAPRLAPASDPLHRSGATPSRRPDLAGRHQ